MGIDNNIDWTVPATPQGEQYGPGLARKPTYQDMAKTAAANKAAAVAVSKRSVMEKILGDNKLAAVDAGGSDPYNATGRQFRR
jgi:hypothetical protein